MSTTPRMFGALLGCWIAGSAANGAAGTVRVAQALSGTGVAPAARGRAVLKLRSDTKGHLLIATRGLAAKARFDVVANGVKVATIVTSSSGTGGARLVTRPRGHAVLLGFDPRGADIQVRDTDGNVVLEGTMPGRGSVEADKIACCLPHGGSDCAIRPSTACAAEGGTPAATGTCLPDPCGESGSTGGAFVCCIAESESGAFVDDSPDVECEPNATSAGCAAAGGTLVQASSCSEHPCESVTPPNLVVCCVPEDSGDEDGDSLECERLTAEHCVGAGGTVSSASSCESHPCGGGSADGAFCHDQHGDGGHGGDVHRH